jgi:hypothetical protein
MERQARLSHPFLGHSGARISANPESRDSGFDANVAALRADPLASPRNDGVEILLGILIVNDG